MRQLKIIGYQLQLVAPVLFHPNNHSSKSVRDDNNPTDLR